jgi:hypothetical protein
MRKLLEQVENLEKEKVSKKAKIKEKTYQGGEGEGSH